jgi:hypothetical protein
VSVGNGVIASNGQAGIEASGATAAVLVNNTLLDSNTSGTSIVSGGHVVTYGNNRIVALSATDSLARRRRNSCNRVGDGAGRAFGRPRAKI